MHVAPDDLAEFERLLAKLRKVQVPAGDVDLPAAEYARNFYVTAAVLVYTLVSNVIASFTTGLQGNISQIVDLMFPLSWTLCVWLVLGTLDSAAAGRRRATVSLLFRLWFHQHCSPPHDHWPVRLCRCVWSCYCDNGHLLPLGSH
jgi:hypothetical protein